MFYNLNLFDAFKTHFNLIVYNPTNFFPNFLVYFSKLQFKWQYKDTIPYNSVTSIIVVQFILGWLKRDISDIQLMRTLHFAGAISIADIIAHTVLKFD